MTTTQPKTKTITIERTYAATLAEVWTLWTTKDGIESWWGPDGFSVEVGRLELHPGGQMEYAMTARAPDQIAFMEKAGMPLTSAVRMTFTEVTPPRRLAYTSVADFIPGIAPYEVATVVELHAVTQGVRLVLTIDAMHDAHWTQMAVMGWESELGKLAKALAAAA